KGGAAVVRDEDIGPAAPRFVPHRNAQRLSSKIADTRGLRNVLKAAVPFIMEQSAVRRPVRGGVAVDVLAVLAGVARHVIRQRAVRDVVADEQVEQAIVIVIDPHTARAPHSLVADSGFLCYVTEAAVALVVKQMPGSQHAAYVDVVVAIVMGLSYGAAHGLHRLSFKPR